MKKIVIIVDFDGTCVKHDYPRVGEDIGAGFVLRDLVAAGHKIVLSTMRSDKPFTREDGSIDSSGLEDACKWFESQQIPLYGIQRNPTQHTWTNSPKPYGQLNIDDINLGCPLVRPENERPYVDWAAVRAWLVEAEYL